MVLDWNREPPAKLMPVREQRHPSEEFLSFLSCCRKDAAHEIMKFLQDFIRHYCFIRQGRWSRRGPACDGRSQSRLTDHGTGNASQDTVSYYNFELTHLLCGCRQKVQIWSSETERHRKWGGEGGLRSREKDGKSQPDAKLFILPIILQEDAEYTSLTSQLPSLCLFKVLAVVTLVSL